MADEPSGVGGLGATEQEYGRFQQAAMNAGFFKNKRSRDEATGNFALLNKGLEQLIAPNSGVLARLQVSLEKMVKTVNLINGSGGGGGGGGGNTANGGASTNPHAGFMGTGISGGKLGAAGAAFGINQLGGAYQNRMDNSLTAAPGIQVLASYSGMQGAPGYQDVARLLQSRSLTLGTTGPADTLGGATIASRIAGDYIGSARGQQAFQNVGALALTNPGMGLSQAAQIYAQLRSGPAVNMAAAYRLPSFQGAGGSQPSPIATSYGLTMGIGGFKTTPSVTQFNNQFAANQRPYQSLVGLLGSQEAADAVISSARSEVTFKQNGGQGILNPQSDTDLRRSGISSPVIKSMRDYTQMQSQNQFIFNQSQSDNIAASLVVQRNIQSGIDKLVTGFGFGGAASAFLSRGIGQVASSPIGTIGSLALMERILGGGGAGGGLGGGLGGSLAGGAGLAGLLKTLGPAAAGLLAGGAIQGAAGKNKAGHILGGAVRGAGFGATAGLLGGPLDFITVPGGALAGGLIGGGLSALGIGDAPATNDTAFVESMSNTGNSGSVTGLNPALLRDLAAMMHANPRLRLNSGFRSHSQQQALWDASDKTGRKVARPGGSMHEKGLAVDIGPASEYGWLRANAGKYGLENYAPEPWHWELKGSSHAGNRTDYGEGTNGGATQGANAVGAGAKFSGVSSSGPKSGVFGVSSGSLLAGVFGSGGVLGAVFQSNTGVSASSASGGGGGTAASSGGGGSFQSLPTGGDKRVPGHSISQWAHDVLTGLGVEPTAADMDALVTWANRESGGYNSGKPGGLFNPLNSTEGHFGFARSGGSQGNIRDYASYQQGLSNIIWNLTKTRGAGYEKIIDALRAGKDPKAVYAAVDASAFGTHGLGDAPMGGGSGASSVSLQSGAQINAVFHVNVQQATADEAERLAQFAHKRIKELQERDEARSV